MERFAQTAGSYWSGHFPRMEQFVRVSNQSAQVFADELTLDSLHDRRAVVSEAAFVFWKRTQLGDFVSLQAAFDEASERLAVVWDQVDFSKKLSHAEGRDIVRLSKSMSRMLHYSRLDKLVIEPTLPGCGVVSGGVPDFMGVVSSQGREYKVIGEMKTVERNFRSTDYRQVLGYAVLWYSATHEVVDYLWLVNPKRGTLVTIDVDSFFWLNRSQGSDQACAAMAYDWSAPGVSP